MWSGSVASIPTGWALCNGTNGAPDLRNKFVIGAGSGYNVAATGGSANAVVVSHTHSVTDPGHTHNVNRRVGSAQFSNSANNYNLTQDGVVGPTSTATTGIAVNSAGQSGIDANLPPYYALCFIIKTA